MQVGNMRGDFVLSLNSGHRKVLNMKRFVKYFLFLLLAIILLTSCTNYQQLFIDEAKAILENYQLENEIQMVYDKQLEGYSFYTISITSDLFTNIPDFKKRDILLKLNSINLSDSKIIADAQINSQGHAYTLNYDNELERDGEIYPPKPTPVPFVMPTGDFVMSWNTYNSEYNSLGGMLTIRRQGTNYTMKLVMPDGSSASNDLTVISGGDEIRLTERPNNPYGDYMYISSTGYLYFCDSQGVIYTVPLLN